VGETLPLRILHASFAMECLSNKVSTSGLKLNEISAKIEIYTA